MPYDPIPGGYIDNQYLADATQAIDQARARLLRIHDERPGRDLLYWYLFELSNCIGQASQALAAMRALRLQRGQTVEAPGRTPGASQTDDDHAHAQHDHRD